MRLPLQIAPVGIFVVLASLILWVWQQQVEQRRLALKRHNEDVCFQASRRIQILVEAILKTAEVFSQRWSSHETGDFSRKRFTEFGSVLTRGLPGFHSIRIIHASGGAEWFAPRGKRTAWSLLARKRQLLLSESTTSSEGVLSPPVVGGGGYTSIFAVLPLRRDDAVLGHLVVELRTEDLIGSGFQHRIRSEFHLRVEDDGVPLFTLKKRPTSAGAGGAHARQSFSIRNRTWRLNMAPRADVAAASGWWAHPTLPLIGLLLSVSLSALIHLLIRRVQAFGAAHRRALQEVEERERAQEALRLSEARYHSAFDSSSDGLLVIDREGRIVAANTTARQMFDREPADFDGQTFMELLSPESQGRLDNFNAQLEAFGSADVEMCNHRKDGTRLDLEVRGTPFDYGGTPHVLAVLTDVTELKQAVRRQALLSRKVLMAQEEERARVSRDLHDELGQILTAVRLELGCLHKTAEGVCPDLSGSFFGAVDMVENAARELRRICIGLRPPLLDDLGLEPAVRLLLKEFRLRSGSTVHLKIALNEDLRPTPAEVALCTYRVLQESLNNVTRHAGAESINISLISSDVELALSVYDDGVGFDMQDRQAVGGSGIVGMRERAYLVGGTLDIRSEPHQGTRVILRIPKKKHAKEVSP